MALGTVLILLAGGGLYSLMRRKKTKPVTEGNIYSVGAEELEKQRRNLIERIAELDDRFQASEIPEEEYIQVRSKNKEKLIELTRKIKKN
jgi:50S ribosomal subunit-associated GTPase HflX